jgi:peptide/nickel transport system substrate-binding protein
MKTRTRNTAMRAIALLTVCAVGCLAAACSSSSAGAGGGSSSGGIVTISNESGSTWTCGFNPFNPSVDDESFGTIYEPLDFVNTLQNGDVTPWLASAYSWQNDNKTLVFTIRSGVKWSDGAPFSASDVVYTFNLMKRYPGLDLNSVWSVLSSVTLTGPDQVTMQFSTSAVPYFYYIADQTPIVPEHIWKSISNPVTANIPNPVGTGPFTMNRCTAENIEYVKNNNYWQPGLPKVNVVNYPAFLSNTPANDELADGQAQWGSQFIPEIQRFYSSKSPSYKYWFPPVTSVSIFINLTNPILKNVAVRQAMSYAINRPRVSAIGEYGYEPPANQTDIVTPTFSDWYDSSEAAAYQDYAYNPQKAISILEQAGFTRGSNGIFQTPSGKPLSFQLLNIGGYSDWVASVAIIQTELAQVGIQITPVDLASTNYNNDVYDGDFQLAYDDETGGPTPYYELRQILYSKNSAPIGQAASTNWGRYDSPSTDALLNEYGATTSVSEQHQIVDQLEQVMLSQVPIIPVTEQVDFYQYDTSSLSGWVTPSDPYAQPSAYDVPDIEVVLLHLHPN